MLHNHMDANFVNSDYYIVKLDKSDKVLRISLTIIIDYKYGWITNIINTTSTTSLRHATRQSGIISC